jgi:hypothetical protein
MAAIAAVAETCTDAHARRGPSLEAAFSSGEYESLWDGICWAVTTVGYGDTYPTSVQGRPIAIAMMFVGIAFISRYRCHRFTVRQGGEDSL